MKENNIESSYDKLYSQINALQTETTEADEDIFEMFQKVYASKNTDFELAELLKNMLIKPT